MSEAHRIQQIIKNRTHSKQKLLFEFILIQSFRTSLFVKTGFYLFRMPVFFTFLNIRISCNQAVAPGITRPICMSMVVTTTDLMFRKIFELLWLDKFHVEMNLVWFWRKLWWFLFVG